jgi:hypothetical protein
MKPTEDPYVLTVDGDHPDQKSTSHAQDQRGVSEISPEPGY